MDPNNLDSMPPVAPTPEPVAPEQPVVPEQPVAPEQPAVPEQPVVPEPVVEPVAPVTPEQPAVQPAVPGQPMMPPVMPQPLPEQPAVPAPTTVDPEPPMIQTKKPRNNKMFIIILCVVALLAVGAAVLAISGVFGGNKKSAPAPAPEPEPQADIVPTIELAMSVCEEYDGKYEYMDYSDIQNIQEDDSEISSMAICQRLTDAKQTQTDIQADTLPMYTDEDFLYQILFLKEDKVDSYWTKMKNSLSTTTNMKVLENSADLIATYSTQYMGQTDGTNKIGYNYSMIYKNAAVSLAIFKQDDSFAEEILGKLGFPELPESTKDVVVDDDGEGSDDLQGNTQRIKDYESVVTAIDNYIVNNSGNLSGILKKGDPSILNSAKVVNETGMDPDGNPYETKAYSYATWAAANDGREPLYPSTVISEAARTDGTVTTTGSQIFVITGADCGGVDKSSNPMPAESANARSFAVYAYLEGGTYFCKTN